MPSHIPTLIEPVSTPEQRHEYAAGLRELADWLDTTEFPVHRYALGSDTFRDIWPTMEMHGHWLDDDDFVKRVGTAARLIGGRVDKQAAGHEFRLVRTFRGGVSFVYHVARDVVCEQVTTQVEVARVLPLDAERAAKLKAELDGLETTTVTEFEAKVDFICPPSLLEARS